MLEHILLIIQIVLAFDFEVYWLNCNNGLQPTGVVGCSQCEKGGVEAAQHFIASPSNMNAFVIIYVD